MKYVLLLLALALAGCTTPTQYSSQPMTKLDKDTEYSTSDRQGGFSLTILYSRYQFIPESDALAVACKQALTSLAHDLAEKQGRRIKPIDEQRIKISFGRNGVTGITSCTASAPADWL